MSFSISSLEHAFASAAQSLVHSAKTVSLVVLPILRKAQASEAIIEAVTAAVSPNAALAERAAFAVLGKVLSAISDAQAAAAANGVNIALDQQEMADLRALATSLKPAAPASAPAPVTT